MTIYTDIIIWCGVAYTWAPAEIFVEGRGANLKKAPRRDKRGAERPHLVKKSLSKGRKAPTQRKVAKRPFIKTKKISQLKKKVA